VGEREARNLNKGQLETFAQASPRVKELLKQGIHWMCFVPLITPRGTVGFLFLARRQDVPFAEQDLDFLKRVASEMALAVEGNAIQSALARERERLRVLQEIDTTLLSSLDIQELLPAVSAFLRKALPHDHVAVCLYDPSAKALRSYANTSDLKRGIFPENGLLGLDDTLTGQTFVERKTKVLKHADLVHVPFPVTQRALALGVRSSCFIPLLTAKGPLGVLTLSSHSDEAFDAEDVSFLEQVAAALAHSLGNALVHKALRMEEERLRVLLKTGASLASNLDIRQVFPSISAHVRHVTHHEFASLLVYDDTCGMLRRQATDFPLDRAVRQQPGRKSHETRRATDFHQGRNRRLRHRSYYAADRGRHPEPVLYSLDHFQGHPGHVELRKYAAECFPGRRLEAVQPDRGPGRRRSGERTRLPGDRAAQEPPRCGKAIPRG
jgi:GAF domain-containing protein